MRTLLSLLAMVVLILTGFWVSSLRHENSTLRSSLHTAESRLTAERANYQTVYEDWLKERNLNRYRDQNSTDAKQRRESQLNIETQKLASLKSQLLAAQSEVGDAGQQASAESHISEAKGTIARLQTELSARSQDGQSINQNSTAYRQNEQANIQQAHNQISAQLQQVRGAMAETRGNINQAQQMPRSPDRKQRVADLRQQLGALNTQQKQLSEQLADLNRSARQESRSIEQEVKSEKTEVAGEREGLQRQLAQAKAELSHWSLIRERKATATNSDKVKFLQTEITTQEAKIQVLQSSAAAPSN